MYSKNAWRAVALFFGHKTALLCFISCLGQWILQQQWCHVTTCVFRFRLVGNQQYSCDLYGAILLLRVNSFKKKSIPSIYSRPRRFPNWAPTSIQSVPHCSKKALTLYFISTIFGRRGHSNNKLKKRTSLLGYNYCVRHSINPYDVSKSR